MPAGCFRSTGEGSTLSWLRRRLAGVQVDDHEESLASRRVFSEVVAVGKALMDLSELSRLLALSALALPALLLWRNLRRTTPAAANRYMFGILGMIAWAIAGVLVFAVILPSPAGTRVVVAAIVFLLAWLGLAISVFIGWVVPPEVSARPSPVALKRITAALVVLAGLSFACVAWS